MSRAVLLMFALLLTFPGRAAADHTAAAVIVELPGTESGLSAASLDEMFWGAHGVAATYQTVSAGRLTLARWNTQRPFVLGPVVIKPKSGENCDRSYRTWGERALAMLGSDGAAAARADHLVFFFPSAQLLGCSVRARGELFGTTSWIFAPAVNTVVHEIGHNLGLGHSAVGTTSRVSSEYGDASSPMGYLVRGMLSFNAPELTQLKWLAGAQLDTVKTRGVHEREVAAIESPAAELSGVPRGIRIVSDAPRKRFLVSYRSLPEAGLPGRPRFQAGVSIHQDRGPGAVTVLLATLRDGEKFFDRETSVTVVQKSHGAGTASIEISLPGSQRDPELGIIPAPVEDADNDGIADTDDCAPSDPARWSSAVAADGDGDGIPDNDTLTGACVGDNAPAGSAFVDDVLDNCLGVSSTDLRDSNMDGIGDACTPDLSAAVSAYRGEALARQTAATIALAASQGARPGAKLALSVGGALLAEERTKFRNEAALSVCAAELAAASAPAGRGAHLAKARAAIERFMHERGISASGPSAPRGAAEGSAPCETVPAIRR